ncbi:MAG: BACON domain-containing carbohydrate-binding protein [Syntrophobacteraceae bacterium]
MRPSLRGTFARRFVSFFSGFFVSSTFTLIFAFALTVACLCAPSPARGMQLGEAPVWPEEGETLLQRHDAYILGASGGLSVDPSSRSASRDFFYNYHEETTPDIAWDGELSSCTPGDTAAGFKSAIALRINYFRAMAGLPAAIALSSEYSGKDQKAALMMAAAGALSHSPTSSWTCYSADGAEAAGKSNLALGIYGPSVIDGYVKDFGTSNGAAGHRRWILYPQTQTMGTGDIPGTYPSSSNALWVFDENLWGTRPSVRDGCVAWPPPGYTPYQVVYPRWSFAYPGADFSSASVTVVHGGSSVSVAQETYASGYGENTLVWRMNGMSSGDAWPKPDADARYDVTVSNVVIGGAAQTFNYSVTVFDPATELVCDFAVAPLSAHYDYTGGDGTIAVSADDGCEWTATSQYDWITVASGASGSGDGEVHYSVGQNNTGYTRTGSLTVAGASVSIQQDGEGGAVSRFPAGIYQLLDE